MLQSHSESAPGRVIHAWVWGRTNLADCIIVLRGKYVLS